MPDSNVVKRKPRLWLRLLLVLIALGTIVASLGYAKYLQIQEQIAMGSQTPPPISVTVAEAEPPLAGGEVTVTIGIATFPKEAASAEELIGLADHRLYEGKNTGRDRVVGGR